MLSYVHSVLCFQTTDPWGRPPWPFARLDPFCEAQASVLPSHLETVPEHGLRSVERLRFVRHSHAAEVPFFQLHHPLEWAHQTKEAHSAFLCAPLRICFSCER